jgi:hypothetical protein
MNHPAINDVPQIDRSKPAWENVMAAAQEYAMAIRRASITMTQANRVKLYMKELQLSENEALRLDWFVDVTQHRNPSLKSEAVAVAFLATEVFDTNDGVNDSWFIDAGWKGQGGGDRKVVDSKIVPVEEKQ